MPILVNESSPGYLLRDLQYIHCQKFEKPYRHLGPVVEWVTYLPDMLCFGFNQESGIHSDSIDHYNGSPVSLGPQWHVKEPWRH